MNSWLALRGVFCFFGAIDKWFLLCSLEVSACFLSASSGGIVLFDLEEGLVCTQFSALLVTVKL